MRSSSKHYAKLLLDKVTSVKGDDERKNIIKAFASLLNQDGMLSKVPEIVKIFGKLWNKAHQTLDAEVSVFSLSDFDATKLHLPSQVITTVHENKSLLGGLTIKIDDYFVDNSIKGNLSKLKESIK